MLSFPLLLSCPGSLFLSLPPRLAAHMQLAQVCGCALPLLQPHMAVGFSGLRVSLTTRGIRTQHPTMQGIRTRRPDITSLCVLPSSWVQSPSFSTLVLSVPQLLPTRGGIRKPQRMGMRDGAWYQARHQDGPSHTIFPWLAREEWCTPISSSLDPALSSLHAKARRSRGRSVSKVRY